MVLVDPNFSPSRDVITYTPTEKYMAELNAACIENSGRFGLGSIRTIAGGVGTVGTGIGSLIGVPYADTGFDVTTELTRRGASDVAASLGFGGREYLDTVAPGNVGASSAAQFMEEVRNQPGVSPTVYYTSKGLEITADLSWAAAQGLNGTKLGSTELNFFKSATRTQSNIGGISANQAATLEQKLLRIPGVKKVRAFGSRTKGTYTVKSDLDIAAFGRVNKADSATVQAMREAQAYAKKIGIGTGKGYRPLDFNVFHDAAEMAEAFRANPNFDPVLGIPKLKKIR